MPELKYLYTCMELWGAIFAIMASIYLVIGKSVIRDQYYALSQLELVAGIMLFFDAWAWCLDGVPGETIRNILYVSNFISFLCNAILPAFLTKYIILSIETPYQGKKMKVSINLLAAAAVLFLSISQYTGFIYKIDPVTNVYERGIGFVIWTVIILVEANIVFAYAFSKKDEMEKRRFAVIVSFIVIPILATAIQIFVYGVNLSNMSIILVSLLMFAQCVEHNARVLFKKNEEFASQELQLQDMRTKIALSQIQPSFLYNALNTVHDLCEKDTYKAQRLVTVLSEYLREDLESIDLDKPVAFEKELNHTKTFLEIEKAKHPNRFEVAYDIRVSDFELPALTVQPIVENAIHHGILKLSPGSLGLISIKTREGGGFTKLSISDNGVGFDVAEYEENTNNDGHIGIINVRERLKIMNGAELRLFSKEGDGTTVDIIIPNKK